MIIAIDGPAGSGKGTIASMVSKKLNLVNIDTGATYRCVALEMLKEGVGLEETDKIIEISKSININLTEDSRVFLNNEDVTNKIREKEVTKIVSQVSSIEKVRENLVNLQRNMAKGKNVIMEGRDITTVVFPEADFKFYLDASIDERVKRRILQNKEKGIDMTADEIRENMEKRDYNDMHKKVGALKRTNDQIYIDTSNISIDEVVNEIIEDVSIVTLKEEFIKLGYTEEDYKDILNSLSISNMKNETLKSHLKDIFEYLSKNGYTKEDIIKMTKDFPKLFSYNIDGIDKKVKDIIDIGYTKKDVIKMTKDLPQLFSYGKENIKKKIKDIEAIGYTEKEVFKMTKNMPQLFGLSIDTINKKIDDAIELGYTKEKVIKITKSMPQFFSLSIDNIKKKIDDIIELGYTKNEVIKMTVNSPQIFGLSIDNISKRIDDIVAIGYAKEEVIKMSIYFPQLLCLSIDNIQQKIDDIMALEYQKEEVIKMTIIIPQLFGYSIENIKQKMEFYDLINIREVIVIDPRMLIQSVNLSYARYQFYINNEITIDITNYKKLFVEQKKFEKMYGITKKDLLKKYDYNKYKEEKEKDNGRII